MDLKDLKKEITDLVVKEMEGMGLLDLSVPVSISARHLHVTQEHLEILFGKNYELQVERMISQPGQYAAKEKVDLKTPKGEIKGIRILGPVRKITQIELPKSDFRRIGLKGMVRNSGDIAGSEGITVIGPKGQVELKEGVIIADRHIHMTPQDAKHYNVTAGQVVSVEVPGLRGGIMNNVSIRVSDAYALDFHVDTDDANAFLLENGQWLKIIK